MTEKSNLKESLTNNRIFDTLNRGTSRISESITNGTDQVSDSVNSVRESMEDIAANIAQTATDIPKQAVNEFVGNFSTAFASIMEYLSAVNRAWSSMHDNVAAAQRVVADWTYNNPNDQEAWEMVLEAGSHTFDATIDAVAASGLAYPVGVMFKAGFTLVSGVISPHALMSAGLALVFIIAVGYALLKARDFMRNDLSDIIERLADEIQEMQDDFDVAVAGFNAEPTGGDGGAGDDPVDISAEVSDVTDDDENGSSDDDVARAVRPIDSTQDDE